MAKTMYDPWSKIITRNGYAGDEVISALQKSIRRSLEEQACMFAYEMYISSPELLEKILSFIEFVSVLHQCILSTRLDIYAVVKKIVLVIY